MVCVCVWQSLGSEPLASHEVAKRQHNRVKNRFANIFPCESSTHYLLCGCYCSSLSLSLSLSLSHQMMSLVSNWERFLERKALTTSMPVGWTWVSILSLPLANLHLSPSLRATTGPVSTLLLKVKWSLPPPLLY